MSEFGAGSNSIGPFGTGYSFCSVLETANDLVGNVSLVLDPVASLDMGGAAPGRASGTIGMISLTADYSARAICGNGITAREVLGLGANLAVGTATAAIMVAFAPEVVVTSAVVGAAYVLAEAFAISVTGKSAEDGVKALYDLSSSLLEGRSAASKVDDIVAGIVPDNAAGNAVRQIVHAGVAAVDAAIELATDVVANMEHMFQMKLIGADGNFSKLMADIDLTSEAARQDAISDAMLIQKAQEAAWQEQSQRKSGMSDLPNSTQSDRDRLDELTKHDPSSTNTGPSGATTTHPGTIYNTEPKKDTRSTSNTSNSYTEPKKTETNNTSSTPRFESFPILLDLNDNGIEIAQIDRSTQFTIGDDGLQHRTAWAGTGDGVLFYDVGGDGKITEQREYVFTEWDPTAKDDMAALRSRFDSNNDGKLTSADAEFGNFKVMVTNPDGTTTAQSLTALNITSLDLRTDTTHITLDDGSEITGQTTYTMNGTTHIAATVTLTAEANGHQVTQTISSSGTGNKTILSVTKDASGQVIGTMKAEGAGMGQPFRKCNAVFGKGTELARKIDEPTTAKTYLYSTRMSVALAKPSKKRRGGHFARAA